MLSFVLLGVFGWSVTAQAEQQRTSTATTSLSGVMLGPENKTRLSRVPEAAEIIFSRRNLIYVMDAAGGNESQITFDDRRHLEHVALSPDRRYLAANFFANPGKGGQSSKIMLFDLERGTERELLPGFHMAGNGGVDWDNRGYIYFTGIDRIPYPKPSRREEHIANYAAHDVWRVRYDGTGLTRLTHTQDRGEGDVSVSEDGTRIAYIDTYIDPPNDYTEVWVSNSDGSGRKLVYVGGKAKVSSVHDPEISPDNMRVVFSQVDPAYRNFPNDPNANTAHNLMTIGIDGSGATRLTEPGPISIIPDWHNSRILYLLLTDREAKPFFGIVVMDEDGGNARRIKSDANIAKWIPSRPAR